MKKTIALFLLIACVFSLIGCSDTTYPPVESTETEATTVMTLKAGEKTYEVKYELYRALFLNFKKEFDGGDDSVWTGDNKDEYISKIHEHITSLILDIYSAFAVCEQIGYDLYSKEVENKINKFIQISVDGGSYGGESFMGYGGDYDAYLEYIKTLNHNYSTHVLLYRYAIAIEAIDEHFIGTFSADDIDGNITVGSMTYTREDVENYYFSDACVRVLRTYISEGLDLNPLARAQRLAADLKVAARNGESAVSNMIMGRGPIGATDGVQGVIIAKNNLDGAFYADMVNEAFRLKEGEVSDVVPIHDGQEMRYYIMYRGQKSEEHFDNNYSDIAYIFLRDGVGATLAQMKETLGEEIIKSDFLIELDYSTITME